MDQDNSLQISFDEWRSFFMSNPVILETITNDPHEMLQYWRSAPVKNSNRLPHIDFDLFLYPISIWTWVIHRTVHQPML